MNITFGCCRDTSGALMDAAMPLHRASFPSHELRLWDDQKAVMSDPDYHFDMCLTDGALAGLILYWDFGSYIYVEHFCIEPDKRGCGYGSRALELLGASGKTVILEIDPPIDEISIRRRGFYERAHFRANPYPHVHPAYHADYKGHELVIMSAPAPINQARYDAFNDYLRAVVMKDVY